jgi:hypothetical protein
VPFSCGCTMGHAMQDVLPGTPLVTVPRSCQLRYDDARDPRLLSLFERIPPSSTAAGATGAWQFKQALLVRGGGLRVCHLDRYRYNKSGPWHVCSLGAIVPT